VSLPRSLHSSLGGMSIARVASPTGIRALFAAAEARIHRWRMLNRIMRALAGAGTPPPSVHTITVIVGFLVLLVGCANLSPVTPVAVSDAKSVSGTWEGIVYLTGSERNDVTLTIRDDGTYDVVSKTNLGSSRGIGQIMIRDGRLVLVGERGLRGIATVLRNSAGDLVMKIDATLSDNSNLSAELWRTR
jgi:hypothetical protein